MKFCFPNYEDFMIVIVKMYRFPVIFYSQGVAATMSDFHVYSFQKSWMFLDLKLALAYGRSQRKERSNCRRLHQSWKDFVLMEVTLLHENKNFYKCSVVVFIGFILPEVPSVFLVSWFVFHRLTVRTKKVYNHQSSFIIRISKRKSFHIKLVDRQLKSFFTETHLFSEYLFFQ